MAEFNSVITTVTGIGNRLGAVILAEIRNIHAFDNPAQLQAFAGLDSSIYQSGQIDLASNGVPLICGRYSYKLPKHALAFRLLLRPILRLS
ncbi:degenerate transposase [Streptococcus pneumoniae]|nr:degenerate transposase [Streptococcus pneumoniae]